MKNKINRKFILIAVISILSTLLLSMGIFYIRFKEQVSYDIKLIANVLFETKGWNEIEKLADEENIRISLIGDDGRVLYDNQMDISEMDNHNNRVEVIDARKKGEASIVRTSLSGKNTYYYAIAYPDGNVLRVAFEMYSLIHIYLEGFISVGLLTICILIFTGIVSSVLTRSILKPIDEYTQNVDATKDVEIYKELVPFVETIRRQQENIVKQIQSRQDFTANVTHELKTPLTSISGYSELIETGMASDQDIKHFAHEIHKNSARLLTTINDIIRLSELDSESDEYYEVIDLYEVAMESLMTLKMNAAKYEVTLYLHGQSEHIEASKERMIELIYNLVDNAIRYNKKDGRVDITVSHDAQGVYLSVKDNGIGIPKQHHERVFERFYRVDKSRSKATGGTGLGLAIVKHIVLNHQATLSLMSEEGKGTEIIVHFDHKENL